MLSDSFQSDATPNSNNGPTISTQRVEGWIILRPPLHAPVTTDLYDTGYHDGQYFKN